MMAKPLASVLLAIMAGLAVSLSAPSYAQPHPQAEAAPAAKPAETIKHLPADVVTHHSFTLSNRKLEITATTGAITLSNADGVAQAQIGFIAYTRSEFVPETRPVSFAMNGGPGSGSAWLNLGLLGPWRLKMDTDAARPSADVTPVANEDTWLDFTDIVFIDPVGTGFSKLLVNNDENRKKYFSVRGDISSLAEAIRIWLEQNRRMASPKFIVGECYSGFRGPRLVRALDTEQGVGIRGLTLISPVLDFGAISSALQLVDWVQQLPSMVAAQRANRGDVSRDDMADVEAYAVDEYASDLLRGEDPAALARRKARLGQFTGLDPKLIELRHGFVNDREYLREAHRDTASLASQYDATVTKPDPFPEWAWSEHNDPMTDALSSPFTSAIYDIYARRLNWLPDGKYQLSNETVFKSWDFGNQWLKPESVTALRQILAEDSHLHVLIAHGLFDLVTPYFGTKLRLDQIPPSVSQGRIDFEVFPGGHMFYSRDSSRAALRKAALKLYQP